MYIHKLKKDNLIELGQQGYKVVPCKDDIEQQAIYNTLKNNGRCARAGSAINKQDKKILFVLTKENNRRKNK